MVRRMARIYFVCRCRCEIENVQLREQNAQMLNQIRLLEDRIKSQEERIAGFGAVQSLTTAGMIRRSATTTNNTHSSFECTAKNMQIARKSMVSSSSNITNHTQPTLLSPITRIDQKSDIDLPKKVCLYSWSS